MSANGAGQRRVPTRWFALAVLMLPVLLVSVDNTVLAFAVPVISEALQPTGTQVLWMVDSYSLVLAGLLIPMGALGDRLGRRKILLIGSLGFTLVSAAAAFAPSIEWLIAARAAIGFFGAMLMPATLSLIRNIFDDPSERRTAIAIWASFFSAGSALGPIVGGFLLEHFWWGSIFLMAVPVMVPLLILAPMLIPESKDPMPGPVDLLSSAMIIGSMVLIVFSIKEATGGQGVERSANWIVFLVAAVGVAIMWLFVRRQLSLRQPMLDVTLFARPVFTGSIIANLISVFSLVGFVFFVSQHLQLVSGYSPVEAGLLLIPGTAMTVVAGLAVVPVVKYFRPAWVVSIGMLINASGYALVLIGSALGWGDIGYVLAFVLIGIGVGSAETISNDLILASVPKEQAGAASAISETAYELGAVLGTAVLGGILNGVYRSHVQIPEEVPEEAAIPAGETLGGAVDVSQNLPEDVADTMLHSAWSAFDSGVLITSTISFILLFGVAVMTRILLDKQPTSGT